jgi:hypothetical protein
MTTQAIITLESLRCIRESDLAGTSHSEPYIWPALAIVTNNSFLVTPQSAILSDSRNVIKSEMRAGETAAIPYPVNTLTANFEDDQTNRQLLLVVGLWEKDDTPSSAVQAGYQAFLDELHAALGSNLISLSQADEAEQKVIIDKIKKRVYDKVYSAEKNKLSGWEKTKVYLGWLNLDDFMGSDFRRFSDVVSTSFTLSFKGSAGDIIIQNVPSGTGAPKAVNPPVEYEIQGNIKVQAAVVNRCQAEIDAVNAAKSALQGLESMIQALQSQLHRATPQEKPGIIAEIKDINERQIPVAKTKLDNAQSALDRCRHFLPDRASPSPLIATQ